MTVNSNLSIQRQLTYWVWVNHTISQCSKWGKGANHVTIIIASLVKDNSIELWQCTQIHLFKGNLPAEYEWIASFHSAASGEKEQIMLRTIIASLVKDNLVWIMTRYTQIHLFKGNLPAEYEWITSFHSSQCSKWGKGANHVSIIIASLIKDIALNYDSALKLIYSIFKGNLPAEPEYEWITSFQIVASGENSNYHSMTRQGYLIELLQCTQIHLFQGNLLPEYERITVQRVGKMSKSSYHYHSLSPRLSPLKRGEERAW